jgi:hypothetical protein
MDESETIITSKLPYFDIFYLKSFQNYKSIIKLLKKLILKIFEVDPITYWNDLEKWLYIKSGIYYSASEKG